MARQRSWIGFVLVLFLALDAIGLILGTATPVAYSATTAPPAPRPQSGPQAPKATERHVCTPSGGDFSTIQAAVDASASGDVIKVAAGVYTESKPSVFANLYISKTVHIYGGYVCGSWVTQNPAANVTTIRPSTGDISVVDIEGQFGNTAAVTPTLDGFTVTGGGGGNHGGGIRIRDSNALINNSIITGNVAFLLGGGIWVQRGAPIIQNNRIQNNRINDDGSLGGGIELEGTRATLTNNIIAGNVISSTSGHGGGIDISGGGPVTISGNSIITNTAAITGTGFGGGLSMYGVTATLSNNTIGNNLANGNYAIGLGGAFGTGGGIYIKNSPAFTLSGNTIVSNTASYQYSVYASGGGLEIESSTGILSSNVITGNSANGNSLFGIGGGLAVYTSTLLIRGGQISNNKTSINYEGYGGGLHAQNSSITIDSVRIDNNKAGNTPFYGLGGGLNFFTSTYTVTNALITNNFAFPNQDSAVGGLNANAASPGLVVNNTFASNNAVSLHAAASLTATNNIIMNGRIGISATSSVSVTFNDFYNQSVAYQQGFSLGASNIVINPNVDATFHLNSGSPMIDAGTHTNAPDHDMDGQPRAMIGTSGLFKIDIGADERTGTAQRNINLSTTAADLMIIGPGNPLENPGSTGSSDWIGYSALASDVNGDNRADLIMAAEDWAEDFDTLNATGRLYGLSNFGTRITGTIDLLYVTPTITVVSKYIRQHIGSALVGGDLNGDGNRDLIFGSYENDFDNTVPVTPTVFALWGGASLNGTRILTNSTPANFMLRAPGQHFSAYSKKNALAMGELNGNSVSDLMVADYLANDGGLTEAGAVFVIFGSNALTGLRDLAVTPSDFTLYGPATSAHLGHVAAGRVNSGSQADLVARTDTTAYVKLGPLSAGSHHLSSTPANITITNLQAGGVIVFDITGDGQEDVILGSGNSIYVIPGPLIDGASYNANTAATIKINVGAGIGALANGNVAGDNKLDLIIGAGDSYQAFVLPGGLGALGNVNIADVAQVLIKGSFPETKFTGFDVAAGDLDFDGQGDLVVTTWGVQILSHPSNFQDAGKVLVFYGAAGSGLPQTEKLYLPFVLK